ncbi:hypothetical protein QBC39DRAFT_410679 [Podospora conica]|nr:hypothetical protein QBC39DRAFT_410679 [Schizothecium conicum]
MTETIDDAAEARAEQARLARKERREAKIRAGGTSRLNKISGVGGGLQRDDIPPPAATTTAQQPPAAAATPSAAAPHADPEEVDISQHFYTPQATRRPAPPAAGGGGGPDMTNLSEDQLRALMLGGMPGAGSSPFGGASPFGFPPGAPGANPFGGPPGAGGGANEDPMMAMMMQMLGGGGVPGGGSIPGFPPGATFPGQPAVAVIPSKKTSIWRLLHTALALGLGLYIALWTSFRGTKGERALAAASMGTEDEEDAVRKRFFYAFATAEAVLLTTRYFVDGGSSGGAGAPGVLGMVVGFLPGQVRGWVEMGMRYARVLGTVRGDVLVLVFVLGGCSWWRG